MEGIYSYVGTVKGLALRLTDERGHGPYLLSRLARRFGRFVEEYNQPSAEEWRLIQPVYDDR